MPSPQPALGSNVAAFEEGMNQLKTAAIIMIIAAILTGVGALASVTTFFAGLTTSPALAMARISAGIAVADMLGGVIVLVATFLCLIKAFDKLKEFNPGKFSTPATIVKIGFPAYGAMAIIAPIAVYATVTQLLSSGAPSFVTAQQVVGTLQTVNALAFIAKAVAMLGIGIGTYYIYEVTDEGLFLAAAILFLIAVFVSLLAPVAWILVIAGAGNAVNKVRASYAAQTQQAGTPLTEGP